MRYDAIVVGAGPSGSACAALLAAKGCKVLLLEKEFFPKDKPCGDAIGGKALNVLSLLGLEKKISEKGFLRNSGIVFSSPCGHEVEIPLLSDGKDMSGGFVCKRRDFDWIVFEKAASLCDTMQGAEAVDLIFEGKKAAGVKVRRGESLLEFKAKLVVGADGANSMVARKAGYAKIEPRHYCSAIRGYYSGVSGLRGNIEIHFLPEAMPGYFWIFPLSASEANVGVGMLLSEIISRKKSLGKVFEECLKSPRFSGRFSHARLEGELKGWSLPLASAKRRCAGNGFILVGDAASLIDPFSGEGIGNGMKSAAVAAEVLGSKLASGEISEEDCLEYEKALWESIGNDVKSSYLMQRLGRHSWLLDFIIGKAKKSQKVRHELASMIASREAKKKAADPIFYMKMLFSD
ncbi:MAG: NAD(P)/FAD-dependent oxidoreductase [Candidatus Micrarchaeota archaeon]|nr:NAD(P)/FAD-dependent oxidoreductase [Candidatus Micrarchaeota archaeon]